MLKDQGNEMSLLGQEFLCYIRHFGGYSLKGLSYELKNIAALSSHDVGTMIVMAGTNDTHLSEIDVDIRLGEFESNFNDFIANVHTRLNPKRIIVLSLFPRAYCKMTHSKGKGHCRNVHQDIDIKLLNGFIQRANGIIQRAIRLRNELHPSSSTSFLRSYELICRMGNWSDLFGGFLCKDGLHMSDLGNKWLDEQIKNFIMGKFCFQSNLSHTCISEFIVT